MRCTLIICLLVLCQAAAWAEPWAPPTAPELETLLHEQAPLPPLPEAEGQVLTLAQCLDQGQQSHPALGAKWAQVLQEQARYKQVWALYYPTLTSTLAESTQTALAGPLNTEDAVSYFDLDQGANASIALSQTIFDFGQRAARVEAARGALRSAYLNFESAWVDQAEVIQSAYLSVVEKQYILAVRNSDLGRARFSLGVAERFLKGGTTSLVDVTQSEIQLAQAQAAVAAAENALRNASMELAQAMGVKREDIQSRPVEDVLTRPVELPPYDRAVSELDTHPKLLSISAQKDSSSASITATRRRMSPNLGVSTSLQGYQDYGYASGLWQVQLLLTIPLFDPTVGPQISEFQAQVQEAQEQWANVRSQLLLQLQTAYSDSEGARQRSTLALRQAKTAVLNYQLAIKRYEAGLSQYTELLNGLGLVSDAQVNYVMALSDERHAEVQLKQATGSAARATKAYFRSKAGQRLLEDMRETELLKKSRTEPTERF